MTPDFIASRILKDCWEGGLRINQWPEDARPTNRMEGYAIQSRLEERSTAPLFGWKIAATSAAGQAHIGVDGPLAGRLLAERVIPNRGECPFGNNHMRVVGIEFAFRIGDTLAPRAEPFSMAGQIVTTGTCVIPMAISPGDEIVGDFVALGTVSVRMAEV